MVRHMKAIFSSANRRRIKTLNDRLLKHHDHLIENYVDDLEEDEKHEPHACEFRILISKCVNCDVVVGVAMIGKELAAKLL